MLIEFKVKNFTSFKEEVVFNVEANTKNELFNNITLINNERILKSAVVFGANASGKTNLIKAITVAITHIRRSNSLNVTDKLIGMVPFKFDDVSSKRPCAFDFTFIVDNIKYNYGFSADSDKIYDEYLYKYSSKKRTMIFNRTNTNDYKFLQADKTILKNIQKQNAENKLFLSTSSSLNYKESIKPMKWFLSSINTYSHFSYDMIDFSKYNNDKVKKKVLEMLNNADISISDYLIKTIERDMTSEEKAQIQAFSSLLPVPPDINSKVVDTRITTIHKFEENNVQKEYSLDIGEESTGTQIIFTLAMILQDVFEGHTMIVDELENSLHGLLVKYIIKTFLNPETNQNNAQLIFTTHNQDLLDLELFRRDQIYFVEKNQECGESELYSLADYSVRKNEDIKKGYKNGRYGAIPYIDLDI